MSPVIRTVCGPIAPEQLGFTSMHEHILADCSMFRRRRRRICLVPNCNLVKPDEKLYLNNRSDIRHNIVLSTDNMKLDDEPAMEQEVAAFKEGGGNAIVEVSAPGIRSSTYDLLAFRRISEHTGVHIIASTGLYVEDTWPDCYKNMTFQQFIDFLRREILRGIGDTGIFPGHLKAAYEIPSQQLDIYLQAAAQVAGETGISLQVHLGPDVTAGEVRKFVLPPLMRGGCIPHKTIFCHVQFLLGELLIQRLVDKPGQIPFTIDIHRELLDSGFILSFTPFGFEADNESMGLAHYPDWFTLAGMVALIREGYSRQLVIGNDVFTKLATRNGGGDGYRRLTDFVVPALKLCDISEEDIQAITVENPARILAY